MIAPEASAKERERGEKITEESPFSLTHLSNPQRVHGRGRGGRGGEEGGSTYAGLRGAILCRSRKKKKRKGGKRGDNSCANVWLAEFADREKKRKEGKARKTPS